MTELLYDTALASRNANIAYHLIPLPVWEAQAHLAYYKPEAYDADGFIHLTVGLEPLLTVANMFYTSDSRQYRVLVLDMKKIEAEIKYEDPERNYPHVYGLLNTDAVIGELGIERNAQGRFVRIGSGDASI
jgi:uncharacterized protein (DUF952 family)